jgi:hypothetical protein
VSDLGYTLLIAIYFSEDCMRLKKIMLLLLLGCSGISSLVWAQPTPGGRVGLFGNLGYNQYAMGDFNKTIDLISHINTTFGGKEIAPIKEGFSGNGGIMFGLSDNFIIGAEANYLLAQTKGDLQNARWDNTNDEWVPTTTDPFELTMPAVEYTGFLKLAQFVQENVMMSGGLAIGTIATSGEMVSRTSKTSFTGSTVSLKFMAGAETWVNEFVSFGFDFGYRFAKITELKDQNGHVMEKIDDVSKNQEADYTGIYLQGGIRLYF